MSGAEMLASSVLALNFTLRILRPGPAYSTFCTFSRIHPLPRYSSHRRLVSLWWVSLLPISVLSNSLLSSLRVLFTKCHFHCFISHLLSTKAEPTESRPTTPEAHHHRDPETHTLPMFLLFSRPEHSPPLLCLYRVIQLSEIRKDPASSRERFPLVLRHNLLFPEL